MCYYAVSERQGTAHDYVVSDYRLKKTSTVIPATVLLTFYGPNADNDAEAFWSDVQTDYDPSSGRGALRKLNILIDGRPDRPVSLFETEGTYHRRRCDVRLDLLVMETKDAVYNPVTVPPDFEGGIFYQL